MGTPQRIAVIGCPGAGKSTLARALAAASGLPLIHLDKEHWQPGWTEPDPVEWQARAEGFAQGERWIIDGQYGHSLTERLRRAELVVYLDLSTRACLWGVAKRIATTRGTVRPDMGGGCPEKLDPAFIHYVLTFRRLQRPAVERAVAATAAAMVRLTSPNARRRFTAALMAGGLPAAMAWPGWRAP